MSFLAKPTSAMIFGSAGVDSEMQEKGYMSTLCTACTDKQTGEEQCIDLHLTFEHLKQLNKGSAETLAQEIQQNQQRIISEHYGEFKPCPLCGNAILDDSVHEGGDDFYFISCRCGCSLHAGDTSLDTLARKWNKRFYSTEQIEMILASEGQQSRQPNPALLKRASFFYWLAVALYCLSAFLDEASFQAGLAASSGLFSFSCLLYAAVTYVHSLPGPKHKET